jgi:hypothetical protein
METIAHPHTAEELAELSTFIHNLAGWLLFALGAAMLVEAIRGPARGRWRHAWPVLGAVIGFGLLAYIVQHMALHHRVSPLSDPMQLQHQLIGLLVGAGATVEILGRRGTIGTWSQAVWPASLVAVGVVFLLHEQATEMALLVHWALAAAIVLGGLALLAVALSREEARSLRVFGVLLLLAASVQLIVFQEEPGSHGHHGDAPAEIVHPGQHR